VIFALGQRLEGREAARLPDGGAVTPAASLELFERVSRFRSKTLQLTSKVTAMRKSLTALTAATTIAIAAVATPTTADAQWRRGGWWGPALGGFALGAIVGSAFARPYYAYPAYGYGYGYPAYSYGYPAYSYSYSYSYGYPAYSYGYPAYYGYARAPYYGYARNW
jgi:hypothetical protein